MKLVALLLFSRWRQQRILKLRRLLPSPPRLRKKHKEADWMRLHKTVETRSCNASLGQRKCHDTFDKLVSMAKAVHAFICVTFGLLAGEFRLRKQ